jgi:hypothetical protein
MSKLTNLSLALCLSSLVSAQTVYRSVDKDGNPVFSDTPTEGAEEIILKEVPTIKSTSVPITSQPEKSQDTKIITYTALKVTSPSNDEVIRENSGDVNIVVELQPDLMEGHKLTLYLDSKEYSDSTSPVFNLTNVDRGTHQLRVAVRDANGKILLSSTSITFHLQRSSVILRPKAPSKPATH